MMKTAGRLSIGVLLAAGMGCSAFGQARPYPSGDVQKTYERLLKEIDKIPMYDNHAHPGYADDSDVDAMASPPDESQSMPGGSPIKRWPRKKPAARLISMASSTS